MGSGRFGTIIELGRERFTSSLPAYGVINHQAERAGSSLNHPRRQERGKREGKPEEKGVQVFLEADCSFGGSKRSITEG